jgi:hypothetical protein
LVTVVPTCTWGHGGTDRGLTVHVLPDTLESLDEMGDVDEAEADEEQDANGASEGGEDPVGGGGGRGARLLLQDGAAGNLLRGVFLLSPWWRFGVGVD